MLNPDYFEMMRQLRDEVTLREDFGIGRDEDDLEHAHQQYYRENGECDGQLN